MKSQSSLGPLNIGNVVTTGFTLFKSNFLSFFKLTGLGYLWLFVPVYGWAKFAMYQGLMARLAFGQLINQPETVDEARNSIKERLWMFWVAGILVGLITGGTYGVCLIGILILSVTIGVAAAALGTAGIAIGVLLGLSALVTVVLGVAWINGRLLLTEMPIAIETNKVEPADALGQSWRLTQSEARRIMVIVFIAALVTLPLTLVVQVVAQLPSFGIPPADSPFLPLISILTILLSVAAGMVTVPFWQCIKAATFYDLRARKEGLDIQLRDRPI